MGSAGVGWRDGEERHTTVIEYNNFFLKGKQTNKKTHFFIASSEKNSLFPNSFLFFVFLNKNVRKFFPQASLSVQTRDRRVTCLSALGWFDSISESLVKTHRGLL